MNPDNIRKIAEENQVELKRMVVVIKMRPSKKELEHAPQGPSEALGIFYKMATEQEPMAVMPRSDALLYLRHAIEEGVVEPEKITVIVVANARRKKVTGNWAMSEINKDGVFDNPYVQDLANKFEMKPEVLKWQER